jgi:hypothetical protein
LFRSMEKAVIGQLSRLRIIFREIHPARNMLFSKTKKNS